MLAPDLSYLTPTCVDEKGTFEILSDRGRQLRYDTPRVRFINPPFIEPPPAIKWLWADRIPQGRVTVIEGPAGAGKTFLTAHLTARVTSGTPWGDGPEGPQLAGEVLYYCSERESTDVVAPRVTQGGADVLRIIFRSDVSMVDSMRGPIGTRTMEFPQDLNMLEYDLKGCPATRLVVIDPLRDFCATPRLMRKALAVLDNLAARYKVAIVVTIQADVRFTPEGQIRQIPRPWDEAARYVWCVTRDPCDPELRRFEPKRTTFCREPTGLAFRITATGRVVWEPLTRRMTLFEKCKAWIGERMSGGAVWAEEAMRDAKKFGFSETMVFRARDDLDIATDREGGIAGTGKWWWTRNGQPPAPPPTASVKDEVEAKYAKLMQQDKAGDEFVEALSAILMRDFVDEPRRRKSGSRRKARANTPEVAAAPAGADEGHGETERAELDPAGVASHGDAVEEKISNPEFLAETAENNANGERPGERRDVSPPVAANGTATGHADWHRGENMTEERTDRERQNDSETER